MSNHRKPPTVKADSRAAVEAAKTKHASRKQRQAQRKTMSENLSKRGM
jgi:hypothetical protein